MISTVYIKNYNAPEIDRREILGYAGVREETDEIRELLDAALDEASDRLCYKVCYLELDISLGECLDLGFAKTTSKSLSTALRGCERIILFAATVGIEIDRLISKYSAISPVKALLLQAIGSERVEALCDLFSEDMAEEMSSRGLCVRRRFSPGYGDLPLGLQESVFAALDCPRKIGVTLNESLIMSPSKSVTAIIGISKI